MAVSEIFAIFANALFGRMVEPFPKTININEHTNGYTQYDTSHTALHSLPLVRLCSRLCAEVHDEGQVADAGLCQEGKQYQHIIAINRSYNLSLIINEH